MCKLFAIVEIENQRNAELFAKKAIPFITKTDNHGLGIMRLGEKGVHIQRWLEPPTIVRKKVSPHMAKYESVLRHQQNEAGRPSKNLYAIAVHGRFATCTRSLQNTHPFYRDGSALMHNGIIPNSTDFPRVVSTCDSEALLSQYIQHDVRDNNIRLTDALTNVGGYYAAIVFNDNGVIDIWRDDDATLFLAHVRGVGVVIATTEEIIISTAKKCKAYVTGIDEILPFTALRWEDGLSPQLSTFEAIKPVVQQAIGLSTDHKEVKPDAILEDHWWNQPEWHTPRGADYIDALTEEEKRDEMALKHLQGLRVEEDHNHD